MKNVSILSTPKSWIKEWFADGTWSKEKMTSVLIRRDNGKLIQVFGYGNIGSYDYLEGHCIKLTSSSSFRTLGYGEMIDYADGFVKGAATYVFK